MTAAKEAERIGGTHIVTIDADGQHDPADFLRFLPVIEGNPLALVVGTRVFDKKASPLVIQVRPEFLQFLVPGPDQQFPERHSERIPGLPCWPFLPG